MSDVANTVPARVVNVGDPISVSLQFQLGSIFLLVTPPVERIELSVDQAEVLSKQLQLMSSAVRRISVGVANC